MIDHMKSGDLKSFSDELDMLVEPDKRNLAELLYHVIELVKDDFVKNILENGADPNLIGKSYQWRPVSLAIEFEQLSILQLLIGAGAAIKTNDSSGLTPLHLAVDLEADTAHQLHQIPVPTFSRCLLGAGADPEAKDLQGVSVFELAEQYSYSSFISLAQAKSEIGSLSTDAI